MNLTHFAPKREWVLTVLLAGLAATVPDGTHARADDPVALLRAYLTATDVSSRSAAVTRIVGHPDYRPSRLSTWLHQAWAYPDNPPGASRIDVPYGPGTTRRVHLILPEGYRPDRAWPLVYALHPSGASGLEWAEYVRAMLGRRAREYVIAAPDGFKQNYIDSAPPFTPEHAAILDAVSRVAHVDPNRVYAFGYSKGGFGAWFVALYYPDRLAGAISFSAGFDMTVDDGGLWKFVIQNIAHVPVYNAWGQRDTLVARDLNEKPYGTFAEQNRRFAKEIFGMGLPITNVEVPGGGHNTLAPPVEPLLGRLTGAIDGQTVRVTRQHIGDVIVWFAAETINWDNPVWKRGLTP